MTISNRLPRWALVFLAAVFCVGTVLSQGNSPEPPSDGEYACGQDPEASCAVVGSSTNLLGLFFAMEVTIVPGIGSVTPGTCHCDPGCRKSTGCSGDVYVTVKLIEVSPHFHLKFAGQCANGQSSLSLGRITFTNGACPSLHAVPVTVWTGDCNDPDEQQVALYAIGLSCDRCAGKC
jgi:hypothetical protein